MSIVLSQNHLHTETAEHMLHTLLKTAAAILWTQTQVKTPTNQPTTNNQPTHPDGADMTMQHKLQTKQGTKHISEGIPI